MAGTTTGATAGPAARPEGATGSIVYKRATPEELGLGDKPTRGHELLRVWTDENGALLASIDINEGLVYGVVDQQHRVALHEVLSNAQWWIEDQLSALRRIAS